MSGYTGPNGRRYEQHSKWVALTAFGASLMSKLLGWLRIRRKR